jgi:hypothetical protein
MYRDLFGMAVAPISWGFEAFIGRSACPILIGNEKGQIFFLEE